MLTRGLFLAPDDNDLKELRRLRRNQEKVSLVESWEENWSGSNRSQDTDKAWKLLFYVFREPIYSMPLVRKELDQRFEMSWLLDLLCIGSEIFYGPNLYNASGTLMCHLDNRKLPIINAHLNNIHLKKFDKHCKSCAYFFEQHGFEFDKNTTNYLTRWLNRTIEFLGNAEKHGRQVLFTAENC